MKNQRKAYLFALSAVLFWSTIGSAMKLSLRFIDFIPLLLIANLVAVVFLFSTLVFQGKIRLLSALRSRDWFRSAIMGLLNPFLYYLVLLEAYDLLQAQEAGTLNYIWPLVLVLLSIPMLRQRISGWSLLAILISFTGLLIISTRGDILGLNFSSPLGVVLAVSSALFWALYWILNMKDQREDVSKLFLNFSFGLFYIVVIYLLRGDFSAPSWQGITGSVYLGIFEMGLTFLLWLKALQYSTTTARVSNLIYLSPFISLIIIRFAVRETILLSTVIGLSFIIGGIILQQYLRK
ncbi:MAG: DMT family transporter [Bacteroidetes bacterium]|nr:MAG: DMT family transporter [Bacteroidota bacterium]